MKIKSGQIKADDTWAFSKKNEISPLWRGMKTESVIKTSFLNR